MTELGFRANVRFGRSLTPRAAIPNINEGSGAKKIC
jgi:hypothetical protein